MSSVGQGLGSVIGAVIGVVVTGGNPIGAIQGASIGATIGGYLDPPKGPTIQGPRLGDQSVQVSTYGAMLPRFYGTIAVAGNITWLENNQLKEHVRKKKSGGKGGGATTTTKIYTYSATFFLSLGLGPIAGVRRIWCSDKLIYNAGSDDLETIIASNQAASGWKLYRGTDDQLPDPRYEADVGVGNAPAYRGEAYLAFYDFQLADFGNSLQGAQFKVEVVTQSDFNGLRGAVDAASGQTYGGGQYIYGTDGATFVSYSGSDYVHALSGNATFRGSAATENTLPASIGDQSYAGRLSNGLYLFSKHTNLTYVDGVDIGVKAPGIALETGLVLNIPPADKANKKLVGCTISSDGAHILLALCDDSLDINTSISTATYYLLDAELNLVSSGPVLSQISAHVGVCWGRTRTFGYVASCLSNDLQHLFQIDGAGGALHRYSITAAGLQFEETLSGAISSAGFFTYPAIYEQDSILYVAAAARFYTFVNSPEVMPELTPLAAIVEQEIALSSLLTAADVDTSLLTAQVRGYRVSGGSIRSALEPPQGTWPFDMIQSGYVLKPVPRGQASVMTIPWEDLGASDGDSPGDLLQESREMDSQLPARTSIKYLDAAREYAIAEQSAARDNTPAINRVDRELPIVLTADEAAGVADVLQNLAWEERSEYAFSLPPIYLALEPADVVTIVAPWATFELRLTEINYAPSGRLECKGRPNRAALYTSNAKGGEGVPPPGTIPLAGATLWLALDIPVIDETQQNEPGFATGALGYTNGWPGAVLFSSPDNGQTYAEVQGYAGKATIGYARNALGANSCALVDQGSALIVDLLAGELESITLEQMIASANYAAYGVDGRWEIIRFQTASLQADGSYQLSGLVRGDKGTEWATGLHQAGDFFVLLADPDNIFIGAAVETLGLARTYRAVTSGASLDSAADQPFTYQGVNLRPLSPTYPVATATPSVTWPSAGRGVRASVPAGGRPGCPLQWARPASPTRST
ncbi:phage tail protein [Pseudomonas sp. JS3066]|uniref:phage tail protein n=1 Tax=Pseudomonas sp. JS3066 TaxID=3090665 RepID=UPI002E7C3C82|nr:phage tail protein [Pseudomonas sp. JS3066]WVK96239.1 phage tail protein [Pseudomonas sp. JS3066]